MKMANITPTSLFGSVKGFKWVGVVVVVIATVLIIRYVDNYKANKEI